MLLHLTSQSEDRKTDLGKKSLQEPSKTSLCDHISINLWKLMFIDSPEENRIAVAELFSRPVLHGNEIILLTASTASILESTFFFFSIVIPCSSLKDYY